MFFRHQDGSTAALLVATTKVVWEKSDFISRSGEPNQKVTAIMSIGNYLPQRYNDKVKAPQCLGRGWDLIKISISKTAACFSYTCNQNRWHDVCKQKVKTCVAIVLKSRAKLSRSVSRPSCVVESSIHFEHPGTLTPSHPVTLAPSHPDTLAPWHPDTLTP